MEWTDEQNAGRAILELEAYRRKLPMDGLINPLEEVALDAIDAGLHSPGPTPNLADLAVSLGADGATFAAVLRDYEIALPSGERDVALNFTLLCVREVLEGRMTPEQGSDEIWYALNRWDFDPLYTDLSLPLFQNLTDMLEQFPWPPFEAAEAAEAIQPDHRAVRGDAEEHLLRVLEEVMDGAMGQEEGAARLRWVLRELPKPRCERLQVLMRRYRWRWRELIDVWS